MKRFLLTLLALVVLLTGCAAPMPQTKQYQATFLDLFDTVTTILGCGESQEAFELQSQQLHDQLLEYHKLFDIYQEYEGIANLKKVNDMAGIAPVQVDERIIRMLLDCQKFYIETDGTVNAAMGSVLKLWHESRSKALDDLLNAALPSWKALEEAGKHISFDTVVIDEAASTVFLADPDQSLDVGAVAKGWAVQQVCQTAPEGLLISVGGNVCATGPKDAKGTPWVVGIQDPEGEDYLHTLSVTRGCVVTSGDYQRYFVVDGAVYHHIIDPETLYPANRWRSVTVVCDDSGVADALSTALFLLPQQAGQQLLDRFDAGAMWVTQDGTILYSPGFEDLIRT